MSLCLCVRVCVLVCAISNVLVCAVSNQTNSKKSHCVKHSKLDPLLHEMHEVK